MITRPQPGALLRETGVVAVLRADTADQYPAVIDALVRGGIRSIELTLTTKGVFEAFASIRGRAGNDVEIGIGTVTTCEQVSRALDVSAQFIVTPTTHSALLVHAVAADVPVYPGGLTPTELHTGWSAGAAAVKLFPASTVGPGYISQLRGPFPELAVLPSGGISLDDAADWIAAGALAVSIGSPLIGDAFRGGSLSALTDRSARLIDAVGEARS